MKLRRLNVIMSQAGTQLLNHKPTCAQTSGKLKKTQLRTETPMSTNFWDAKIPDDEEKPVQQKEVEPVEKPDTKQSDKIQFPNPLKIQVDGKGAEFHLDNPTELSHEAIRAILAADEFWIIDLGQDSNSFFQMHIESGQIEYWQDGNIIHQQIGDIGQAMDYLESIIPEAIPSEKRNASDNVWSQTTPNNEISTSQRIVQMRSIDIQQLEQTGSKETYHFPNIAAVIFGGGASFFALISLINGAILPLLILSFLSFIGLVFAFSQHTKIVHYFNDSTFVWYKAQSVDFIYQKQAGDKLEHWEEVKYYTDSDGDTSSTTHYHFRIIDSSGGELYSRSSLGRNNRAKVTNLLSLPTGKVSRRAGKIKYHDPGSSNFNVLPASSSNGVLRTVALFPVIIFLMFGFVIVSDIFLGDEFGYDYEMPDRWCDESVNYPVTVPLDLYHIEAMQGNREDGTYSDTDLVINGGICTYRYRTGGSSVFEFEYALLEASDIDGISMLVMPHPGGQTVGYSGLEVYTRTDEGSPWEQQIDSPYMFGDYERGASHENYPVGFYFGEWFRHAFDSTVENVSFVKIVTGNADQLGDMSVSFSGLRVDAVGDYDYPDYLICSGEWDGLFENSTSDMIAWDPDGC